LEKQAETTKHNTQTSLTSYMLAQVPVLKEILAFGRGVLPIPTQIQTERVLGKSSIQQGHQGANNARPGKRSQMQMLL
jgi:hypothetical protein